MGRAERRRAEREQKKNAPAVPAAHQTVQQKKGIQIPNMMMRQTVPVEEAREIMEKAYAESQKYFQKEKYQIEITTYIKVVAAAILVMFRGLPSKTGKSKIKFGQQKLFQLAQGIYNVILQCITDNDLLDKTLEETGIIIQCDDPCEPVVMRSVPHKKAHSA